MKTVRTIRLTARDWTGDGVITAIAGALLAVAVILPWANDREAGRRVSYALTKPEEIQGILSTPWGLPALGVGVVVLLLGVAMIALGPHRLAVVSGAIVTLAGVAANVVALDAAREALSWGYAAGPGLMLTLLVGILLIPIGIASAMVGFMLRRQTPAPEAPAA